MAIEIANTVVGEELTVVRDLLFVLESILLLSDRWGIWIEIAINVMENAKITSASNTFMYYDPHIFLYNAFIQMTSNSPYCVTCFCSWHILGRGATFGKHTRN